MRIIRTHIPYDEYKKWFENFDIKGMSDSSWYELLEATLVEIQNDSLEVLVFSLDSFVAANLFSKKKFVGSQILVLKEYIKRVDKAEKVREELVKKQLEAQEIARKKLQEFRIEMMKDPAHTGIAPLPDRITRELQDELGISSLYLENNGYVYLFNSQEWIKYKTKQTLEDLDEDALRTRIAWHGDQSLEASFEGDRENAAIHDREAADLTEMLKAFNKRRRYMEAYDPPRRYRFDWAKKFGKEEEK